MRRKKNANYHSAATTTFQGNIIRIIFLSIGCIIGSAAFMLTACVSGSGGSGIASGGIGGTGISYGTISGFGSVLVNGVEFSTSGASFVRDEKDAGEGDFQVGDVVRIQGTINTDGTTGSAVAIQYQTSVRGEVTGNPGNETIEVLGQSIHVNSLTVFDGFALLSQLTIGSLVEVSAIPAADGSFEATRVSLQNAAGGVFESVVTGSIANLDLFAGTFSLGNLVVNFASADLSGISGNQLSDGQQVIVGTTQDLAGNRLIADSVEEQDGVVRGSANDLVDLEGFITNASGNTSFMVNGQLVQVLSSTKLRNGMSQDVVTGARVEVEGTLNSNNVLIADEIEIQPASVVVLDAQAEAIDASGGFVAVLGTVATIDNRTQRLDNSSIGKRVFGLDDVGVGDHLKVQGFIKTGGIFVATSMERKDDNNEIEVQGPVTDFSASNNTVDILGVTFVIQPSSAIEDVHGNTVSSSQFFASLQAGITVVEVQGQSIGTNLVNVKEIKIGELEFDEVDSDSVDFGGPDGNSNGGENNSGDDG